MKCLDQPKNSSCRNLAFTLIELLIVVAIIAILAAIAVPNFLEAQTRSKISRNMSDMRSVSTALGAYNVDWNKYPERLVLSGTYLGRLKPLTKPVAYMTSIPDDVFKLGGLGARSTLCAPYVPDNFTFDYFTLNEFKTAANGSTIEFNDQSGKLVVGAEYQMRGWGPDMDCDAGGLNPDQIARNAGPIPYDPTNGTVSNGDIKMFGPGNTFHK